MKKTVATLAVLAALALTGCSAGGTTAEPPAPVSASPVAHEPSVKIAGATTELQAWAESAHADWVGFYDDGNPRAKDSIMVSSGNGLEWARNLEWSAPTPGNLVITVEGNGWDERDLKMISGYVYGHLYNHGYNLDSVTAQTQDGTEKSQSA